MIGRLSVLICVVVGLKIVIDGWENALFNWFRHSDSPVVSALSGVSVTTAVRVVTAAFLSWAVWRASGSRSKLEASVRVLSVTAVLILMRVVLMFHELVPDMWRLPDELPSLSGLSYSWLFLASAAVGTRFMPREQSAPRRLMLFFTTGVVLVSAMSAMVSGAWILRLERNGGGLTGGPVDLIRAGFFGGDSLDEMYDGSALLLILASLGAVMVFVYALRCVWATKFPRIAATGLATLAWTGWPGSDGNSPYLILFSVGLALAALLGVAVVAASKRAPGVWGERIAVSAGFGFGVWAWRTSEPLFGFVPFAVSVGIAVLAHASGASRRSERA